MVLTFRYQPAVVPPWSLGKPQRLAEKIYGWPSLPRKHAQGVRIRTDNELKPVVRAQA